MPIRLISNAPWLKVNANMPSCKTLPEPKTCRKIRGSIPRTNKILEGELEKDGRGRDQKTAIVISSECEHILNIANESINYTYPVDFSLARNLPVQFWED
jgi:hypothetical protein